MNLFFGESRIEIGYNVSIAVKTQIRHGLDSVCQLPANLSTLKRMVINEVQISTPQVIPEE